MEPTNGVRTWQWVVTVIVIIVLVVIGIMVFGGKKTTDTSMTPDTSSVGSDTTSGDTNRIAMNDQYPGNVVYLNSVQLAKPGWVVIHKDNAGQPGAIIGSAYFDAGINPGKITLTSATVEGGTYYAMLHSDDGDKKFDETKDVPLTDSAGRVIMQIFHASASVSAGIKG